MPVIVPAKNSQFFRIALLPERLLVGRPITWSERSAGWIDVRTHTTFPVSSRPILRRQTGSRTRAALSAEMDVERPKSRSPTAPPTFLVADIRSFTVTR
jgi:hypothetical protein